MNRKPWMSPAEAAKCVGISPQMIRHLVRIEKVKSKRRGLGNRAQILISPGEVERLRKAYAMPV